MWFCFEDVSSQWNRRATTEPEANNYVTVNNTEGYWAVLLPCRYYSARIIQLNRFLHLVALLLADVNEFPPVLHLIGKMWHHTLLRRSVRCIRPEVGQQV